ncbi:MAG: ABC transporter permease [Planctomycetes bacterium]|nr:ABC transporter permease [Planctomycetota bacterium]
MSAIWTLARKDLLVLSRDRVAVFWMFGMPLLFAAFFGAVFGGSGPGKTNPLQVAVVDADLTAGKRRFAERLDASEAIAVEYLSRDAARDAVRRGRKLAWIDIVSAPEEDLGIFAGQAPVLEIGIDPSRGAERGFLEGLVHEAMFAGFRDLMTDPEKTRAQLGRMRRQIAADDDVPALQKLALTTFFAAFDTFLGTPGLAGGGAGPMEPKLSIVGVERQRRGPPNAYAISFPQSILWGILGCATGFALSFVRERSRGTLVRLLSAPVSRGQLIAGKTLACALSCCLVAVVMTTIGALAFGVAVDSVPLLALAVVSTAFCFAGITTLLGSLADTEEAVSGLAWGTLLVCAMLGGGMVPQIAMPAWMLDVGAATPTHWTIRALEGAIWRGFSFAEMVLPCAVLLGFGAVALLLGTVRLRRRG